jgi:hypothetical protein
VYRSGNILARSINGNACSWRRLRKIFDSMRQSFQAKKAKWITCSLSTGA